MPAQTPVNERVGPLDFLRAAGIHVAGKEEHAGNPRRNLHSENQSDACAIAPTNNGCLLQPQGVHHGYDIGSHQLVRVGSRVPRTPTVSAAINEHNAATRVDERRNLITPVATVSEATMEQDYRRTGPMS